MKVDTRLDHPTTRTDDTSDPDPSYRPAPGTVVGRSLRPRPRSVGGRPVNVRSCHRGRPRSARDGPWMRDEWEIDMERSSSEGGGQALRQV